MSNVHTTSKTKSEKSTKNVTNPHNLSKYPHMSKATLISKNKNPKTTSQKKIMSNTTLQK